MFSSLVEGRRLPLYIYELVPKTWLQIDRALLREGKLLFLQEQPDLNKNNLQFFLHTIIKTYVSSVINDDIDASEFIDRLGEDGFYLLDFRDIQSND